MKSEYLVRLRNALNQDMRSLLKGNRDLFDSKLPVDVIVKESDLDLELAYDLEKLGPFGCQNEKPLFQLNSMRPSDVFFMGDQKQHVKFSGIGEEGKRIACVLFKKAQEYDALLQNGTMLNLAGYPDINTWNGNCKIQFILKGITC